MTGLNVNVDMMFAIHVIHIKRVYQSSESDGILSTIGAGSGVKQ